MCLYVYTHAFSDFMRLNCYSKFNNKCNSRAVVFRIASNYDLIFSWFISLFIVGLYEVLFMFKIFLLATKSKLHFKLFDLL